MVNLAPQIPRKGVPSASPSSIFSFRARLRSCENDGVLITSPSSGLMFLAACSRIAPSTVLHPAPVPTLKIAAPLTIPSPNTNGWPFLPSFISSMPPYSSSLPTISARYLPLSTYFLSGCFTTSLRLLHAIRRRRSVW